MGFRSVKTLRIYNILSNSFSEKKRTDIAQLTQLSSDMTRRYMYIYFKDFKCFSKQIFFLFFTSGINFNGSVFILPSAE